MHITFGLWLDLTLESLERRCHRPGPDDVRRSMEHLVQVLVDVGAHTTGHE